MELLPGGLVLLAYGPSVGNGGSIDNQAIVGFSPGGAEPMGVPIDWSAIPVAGINSGVGAGIALDANNRPVLGTTIDLTVSLIPGTTPISGIVLSTTKLDPGIPLGGVIGVPCNLHAGLDLLVTAVFPGTSFTSPLAIPNTAALAGALIAGQGFGLLNPTYTNPLGATTSNGLELILGN
jgi:hypothetical protein